MTFDQGVLFLVPVVKVSHTYHLAVTPLMFQPLEKEGRLGRRHFPLHVNMSDVGALL